MGDVKKYGHDTAHPKDLALVILRDLHVLDADDLLVRKHALVLGWELLPRFACFLLIPVFSLRLSVIHCQREDIGKRRPPSHSSLSARTKEAH